MEFPGPSIHLLFKDFQQLALCCVYFVHALWAKAQMYVPEMYHSYQFKVNKVEAGVWLS